MLTKKVIAVDFDGTIVYNSFPRIGRILPYAKSALLRLIEDGNRIILHTMRSGDLLQGAVDFMKSQGIALWGVNKNKSQKYFAPDSIRVHADIYIDKSNACACLLTAGEPAVGEKLKNSLDQVQMHILYHFYRPILPIIMYNSQY